jgi:hypothetical protein
LDSMEATPDSAFVKALTLKNGNNMTTFTDISSKSAVKRH